MLRWRLEREMKEQGRSRKKMSAEAPPCGRANKPAEAPPLRSVSAAPALPGTDKTHQSEGSTPGSPLGSKPMSFVSLVTAKSIDFLDETAWEATAKRRKARMRKSLSPTSVSANSQAHKHRTLGIKMEAHGTGWSITDSGVHSDKIHEGDLFLQLTSSLLPPPCSRQVRKLLQTLLRICACTEWPDLTANV